MFSYINDNNLSTTLPTTKDKLINVILEYWKKDEIVQLPNVNERPKGDIQAMATEFSTWFYSIMNQTEPIPVNHFFPDAIARVTLITSNQRDFEERIGQADIAEILHKTRHHYGLYFNPNLMTDGVRGLVDPHGLVIVLACGTLHANNTCSGIFEQMFSLARDPICGNNWKIKKTELNLRSDTNINQQPKLSDCELSVRYNES